MKRILKTLGVTACAAAACCAFSISASAKDIYDVCQALRDIGIPEHAVQECMNYYYSCEHDTNGTYDRQGNYYLYDDLYYAVLENQQAVRDVIFKQFPSAPVTTPSDTAPAPDSTQPADGTGSSTSVSTTTAAQTKPNKSFASMTLEEKKAYVATMSEAERQDFLNNLTVDERNSIIKQLSADDKTDIAQIFIDTMKQMGFSMTVDDIDNLDISVRDQDGVLIDSSSISTIVEDTGWDLRAPFFLAVTAMAVSLGGFAWFAVRTMKREEQEAANV